MTDPFVAEILRATGTLRAGDPAGATAIIQAALAAGGLRPGHTPAAPPPRRGSTPAPGAAAGHIIEGTVIPADATPTAPPERPRRPLGATLRALTEGRRRLCLDGLRPARPARAPVPEAPLPEGAAFHDRHFACAAGARRYRLDVPASAGAGLEGLVVMLHGCTQTPEDFAAGTGMNALAEEHRLLVAYPAQTGAENAMSCWNWFRPGDQTRDAGEPAILAGLAQTLRDEHAVPRDRVFVAGLSAGGAMAAILAETHPELFAAVGVHSGLAAGSASDVVSAFAAMRGEGGATRAAPRPEETRPRLIVFQGSADATVHPGNAERLLARHAGTAARADRSEHPATAGRRGFSKRVAEGADGTRTFECWMIDGAPHAWSGGDPRGSYTDPQGPGASAAMVRFFLEGSSDA
jgi:poly(hydroxyalkanoate) depolymerase family esterase